MPKQLNIYIYIIIGLVVLCGGYFYINNTPAVTPGAPYNSSTQMDSVIESQKTQYNIMLRQNVMPDTCAAAKTVAMLYLQQEDETNYTTWNATAASCEEAYIASKTEGTM